MNNFHQNDLYHDPSSSTRSPRTSHPHQAHTLHRDSVRPYDGYLNQPYAMDDVQSRFDAPRYGDQMNQSMRGAYGGGGGGGGGGGQYDMSMPSAWNSNTYGHGNTLAALGATTRGKQGQRSSRPGLPSMWLEQPQPIQPNTFNSFGNPPPINYAGQMRHDHIGSDTDEDLIPTAIVIKNIPFAVKKEQLVAVMTDMALPLPYAFNYHFDNGVFRGLAFANFTSPEETAAVIQAMNHLDLHGRKLRVEYKKMLPQAERDRIEREKRERRGQLEEQHRPVGPAQLNTQPSMSSLGSHIPATSPSPNSSRNAQVGGPIDMNDPVTLGYYSKLLLFQGDANAGEMFAFSSEIPATHRKLIHGLAHQLGLGHASHGTGDSRQVHIYRNPNGMSPPLSQNAHPLDAQRRQLNRSATTDFSNVRAQDAGFYSGIGNQSAGFLGFPDTQGGLSVGSNLRAAKSFADLRSYTPSPAQSASSFPAGLTGNISRFQEYGPGSPGSSRSNITPTTSTMPDGLLNGMGNMSLGGGFGQPTSGSPHRLRGMMSWDREGPGPIGGHRTFSAQQDDANRNRSQGAPVRQPRGPVPERGAGFPRGRQNGHQTRGSDDISASGVEITVE